MKNYHKILRRLNSHPRYALELLRQMNKQQRSKCKKCGGCGGLEVHSTSVQGMITYRCRQCQKTYSELFGTLFYRSKVPIHKWMIVLMEWSLSTGSLSAAEAARRVGLSYDSAWQMLMKIRTAQAFFSPDEVLSGVVEIDEAWFGKGRNQDIVLGLVERTQHQLRLVVIPNTKEHTIHLVVKHFVKRFSTLITDGATYYGFASVLYKHYWCNHSQRIFSRGNGIHSNTIEQIWGDIKGIIRTIHHGVSKKYRSLYLPQYSFRYNAKRNYDLFFFSLFAIANFSPNLF